MVKKVKKSKRSALKPAFSHWHKQLMRIRLNAYKLNSGYEGWIDVADNIIGAGLDKGNYLGWSYGKKTMQIKWLQAKQAA